MDMRIYQPRQHDLIIAGGFDYYTRRNVVILRDAGNCSISNVDCSGPERLIWKGYPAASND
jgi:hypothetical protein